MGQTEPEIPRPRTDDRPMWNIVFGILGCPAVFVAHDLKLFSFLAPGPRSLPEICQALGIARRPAEALLSLCASLGFLERQDGRYALTGMAEDYLLESSPAYFGGFIDMLIVNYPVFSFESLRRAVLSNASQVYNGDELFKSHEEQAALARAFTLGMHGHSMAAAIEWPHTIDLSGARHMLDIGGGSGAHAIGAALRWPDLRATVCDLPPVCEVAEQVISRYRLQDRIGTRVCDMWSDDFPATDLHFYADIFHDWPAEKCRALAEKSFRSLEPGGRIILHEMLYDNAKTGPFAAAAYGIAMLLWTEGQQFSGRELSSLLRDAGFVGVEAKPSFGYWSIITGRKP